MTSTSYPSMVPLRVLLLVILLSYPYVSAFGRLRTPSRPFALSPASFFTSCQQVSHSPCCPLKSSTYDTVTDTVDSPSRVVDNDVEIISSLTEAAIRHRGQLEGFEALSLLSDLSQRRQAYDFETTQPEGSVVSLVPELIPENACSAFLQQVQLLENHLSTNLDSVDGLPSLHLKLVADGKPLSEHEGEVETGIQTLFSIVQPYIYDRLLPQVQELVQDPTLQVSEVFLRRYGEDIAEVPRHGISAHYDVQSLVTAVTALDNVAASGTNGLYTTATSVDAQGRTYTSNHSGLRRYFPLRRGDTAVHTWDVLHGVDIEPGLDRTSLIVWFTSANKNATATTADPSWLSSRSDLQENHVAQFVLANALESNMEDTNESAGNEQPLHPHDLYLKSASLGNAFALAKVGSLCATGELSRRRVGLAWKILERLEPSKRSLLPASLDRSDRRLALCYWLEAAVRGNPYAQISLADELMEDAVATGNSDLRLLATVLFGLAAQQGSTDAMASLSRVVEYEVTSGLIESQDDFFASPVIQAARVSTSALQ